MYHTLWIFATGFITGTVTIKVLSMVYRNIKEGRSIITGWTKEEEDHHSHWS